jgi:hypothetical protein
MRYLIVESCLLNALARLPIGTDAWPDGFPIGTLTLEYLHVDSKDIFQCGIEDHAGLYLQYIRMRSSFPDA